MLWKHLARPLLFSMDAERAHYLAMGGFSMCSRIPGATGALTGRSINDSRLSVRCMGLDFPNPVGLAAGFDKDGRWFNLLGRLGFGSIEIGTVTRKPQSGNPVPRLFRLPDDRALINRMGFNNLGAEHLAERLKRSTIQPLLGINIGLNKTTAHEHAEDDYLACFEALSPFASYVTVNVSSPNTPGLRDLQDREPLSRLIDAISIRNKQLSEQSDRAPCRILLKIAPDLSETAIEDVVGIAKEHSLAGLIATNTTVSRDGLKSDPERVESCGIGGLSGQPLTQRSREVVSSLYRQLDGALPVIGVGGIMDVESAWKMMQAGADLIQVYTGFIYGGPRFVRHLLHGLRQKLDERGLDSISEIVGERA